MRPRVRVSAQEPNDLLVATPPRPVATSTRPPDNASARRRQRRHFHQFTVLCYPSREQPDRDPDGRADQESEVPLDWRRRPFRTKKTAAPSTAPKPEVIRKDACDRLRAAVRSTAPDVRQALVEAILALDRVLSSGALDESNKPWYRTTLSALRWSCAAQQFAVGEVTAREAIRSLGYIPRGGRLGHRLHPRHDFATSIDLAESGRRDARVILEAEYNRDRSGKSTLDAAATGETRGATLIRQLVCESDAFDGPGARQRFITSDAVEDFAAALAFTTKDSLLDWESVTGGTIAAIDPIVGLALGSKIIHRGPFPPESDGQTSLDAFARTVERAMRRMLEPSLPDAYRRMLASIVYNVTANLIDARDNHEALGHPIIAAARLYWTDLYLAAAHRADSVFYGQGPVTGASDEALWRAACYHERHCIDDAAWLEACITVEALHRFGARGHLEVAPVIAFLASTLPDAGPVIELPDYEALRTRLKVGHVRGWIAPGYELESSESELERWLATRPGVAALSAMDMGLWYLTFVDEDGKLAEILIGDDPTDEDEGDDDPDSGMDAPDWLHEKLNRAILGRRPSMTSEAPTGSVELELEMLLRSEPAIAIGHRLASQIRQRRLSTILVMASPDERTWPWEGLPADNAGTTLAELASFVHMHSLLPIATRDTPPRQGTLHRVHIRNAQNSPIQEAWPSASLGPGAESPSKLREALQTHGVLRLLTRADVHPADGMFTRLEIDEQGISAREIRALDLTGCGRVELWGCPLHDLEDAFDGLMSHRGPTNVGACIHLAGARVVIGCPWGVPLFTSSLIAASFSMEAPRPEGAQADARALARAIRRYRDAVKPDGVMERMIWSILAAELSTAPGINQVQILSQAYDRGWTAAFRQLTDASSPPVIQVIGEAAPEISTFSPWFQKRVAQFLGSLRAGAAWAGWRIVARDRRCISTITTPLEVDGPTQ